MLYILTISDIITVGICSIVNVYYTHCLNAMKFETVFDADKDFALITYESEHGNVQD